MREAALLTLLLATGCVTVTEKPPHPARTGTCDAAPAAGLIGREATEALGAEALRLTGASRLRWLRPGTIVTMEFSPGRLNLRLDDQGRVTRIICG